MRNLAKTSFHAKFSLPAAALAAVFALATAAPAVRAGDDCQERMAKIDHKLHDAIEHHGNHSSQADHWRHELAQQRDRCWAANHRWWSEDDHRWHTERDWDEHDHD
jgi:hypothetical protein